MENANTNKKKKEKEKYEKRWYYKKRKERMCWESGH